MRLPLLTILLGVQLTSISWAVSGSPDSPETALEAVSADEIMDTESSIDDVELDVGLVARGDLRTLYSYNDVENRAGERDEEDNLIGRVRTGFDWTFRPQVRASARIAGSCTDEDCDLSFTMDNDLEGSTLERGAFTFDELFIQAFKSESFNIALGRLQTKLVTRAGVFSKSLDRSDSNNANITWTDGLHGTMRHSNGWESFLFLQYNPSDGATNVRSQPLDFSAENSRVTSVFAFQSLQPLGPIVQRGFDVNYLPSSLLKDGRPSGRREDYWGLVGRLVAEWPLDASSRRLRLAGEAGYAPETQTNKAALLEGDGDADGFAWNVAASITDFFPGHDIGLNYGRVDAGWLISPNFAENEELIEFRYRWRRFDNLALEFRARQRNDIDRLESARQKRDRFDAWVRISWRFSLLDI